MEDQFRKKSLPYIGSPFLWSSVGQSRGWGFHTPGEVGGNGPHLQRKRKQKKKRQENNRKLKKEWAKGRKETLKKNKNLAWRSLKIVN